MKIEASHIEGGTIILKEVFNSVIMETAEGNQIAICMRDDTFELTVVGSGDWYRADIKNGSFDRL